MVRQAAGGVGLLPQVGIIKTERGGEELICTLCHTYLNAPRIKIESGTLEQDLLHIFCEGR